MKFFASTVLTIYLISDATRIATAQGKIDGSSNIIGGSQTASGAYPFFTAAGEYSYYLCGASLIHTDIVMTAAHCNDGTFTDDGVLIGLEDWDKVGDAIKRDVALEIPHPDYDDDTAENDIMLLKLSQPVTNVQPVKWASSPSAPSSGATLTVMGFGTTSEGGDSSDVLLEVDVAAVDDNTCVKQYDDEVFPDVMFCATVRDFSKDSCQGDSGGPIIDQNGIQVGIVSWGYGCAQKNYPGVYTRVGYYDDWIKSKICEYSSSPPEYCGNGGDDGNDGNDGGDDGNDGNDGGDNGNDGNDGGDGDDDRGDDSDQCLQTSGIFFGGCKGTAPVE